MNVQIEKQGYNVDQVIEVIEMLSHSQGYYGRLLKEIMYIKENDPERFDDFKFIIERKGFTNPVDVVMFFLKVKMKRG